MNEVTTALTDGLLAAVAVRLGVHALRAGAVRRARARALWGASLVALAAAAAAGGIYHALRTALDPVTASAIWQVTLFASGATASLFALAAVYASASPARRRILNGALAAELVLYVLWTWAHDDFVGVIVHSLACFALVLALEIPALFRRVAGSGWIVSSVAVFAAGSAVQRAGLGLPPLLDHNGVYHLIETVGAVLVYRGARVHADFERT